MDIKDKILQLAKRDLLPEKYELFVRNNLFQYVVDATQPKSSITFVFVDKYFHKEVFRKHLQFWGRKEYLSYELDFHFHPNFFELINETNLLEVRKSGKTFFKNKNVEFLYPIIDTAFEHSKVILKGILINETIRNIVISSIIVRKNLILYYQDAINEDIYKKQIRFELKIYKSGYPKIEIKTDEKDFSLSSYQRVVQISCKNKILWKGTTFTEKDFTELRTKHKRMQEFWADYIEFVRKIHAETMKKYF